MPYRVTIADNFHYGDESEYVDGGEYATYEDALARAKRIVDDSLWDNWETGISPEDLMARYTQFGDDPFIVPAVEPRVSARAYARGRAANISKQREGWLPASEMP
jgi:hypothetical protein